MNLPGLLKQSRQLVAEFWVMRDARERVLLASAAAVMACGVIYALLIDPAVTGRSQLSKNLPVLRQQVAQLQALSKETAALSGNVTPPLSVISKESIETALSHKGLKPQDVTLTGGLAKVQLNAASFSGILNWLDDVQKTALLSVSDANIVAQDQPDMVNATITLRQHGE